MERITAETDTSKSTPIVSENVDRLAAMFPEALVDGKVDFDVLRQLLGADVEESDERYGLTWHGKRQALQLAQTPSTGTLRPSPEDSEEWDTTKNLMIEGDNLEVLKLLQKSYAGKVKLIYIDPPYNTGKDFVYKDNYRDNIANYLEQTGQVDEEGNKTSTNTEASGRFHTDWLNMMYPRLKLARELLTEDGVLCVSIDDVEGPRLRQLLDILFGETNLIAQLIWKSKSGGANDASKVAIDHEYVIVYGKDISRVQVLADTKASSAASFNREDEHGRYYLRRLDQQNLQYSPSLDYEILGPDGVTYSLEHRDANNPNAIWRWSEERVLRDLDDLVFEGGHVYTKIYEPDGFKPRSLLVDERFGRTRTGGTDLAKALGNSAGRFSYPKPLRLLQHLQLITTSAEDIVLDFFAGSGTTGHAVMAQNAEDGGSRRFILVQLPEPLDPEVKEQKAAAEFCDEIGKPRNLAELTKERLRRAAKKIAEENPDYDGDLGFRDFKLDSSNIREWDENPEDLEESLLAAENHVKEDRTDEDLLYELLLKQGIDLSEPIETKEIASHQVQSIGAGTLITCLDQEIAQEETQALGEGIAQWHKELDPAGETTCIFRDSAFPNDVAKTNLTETLNQNNINTIRSI